MDDPPTLGPTDLDLLCDLGAQWLHDPINPRDFDLRGQGLSAVEIHTITDVPITGNWL